MRALRFVGTVFLFFASVHPSVSSVLVDFQVAQPPPVPKDTKQCTIELFQSVIAMTIFYEIITSGNLQTRLCVFFWKVRVPLLHLDTWNGSPDRNFKCSNRGIYVCNFSNYIYPCCLNFLVQTSGGLRSCRLLGCHHSQFHSHQQWHPIRSPGNIYIPRCREQVNNYFCKDGCLMTLFLVWRTSTPEPTRGDGIIWTYIKDVTRYKPLFEEKGPFILQLDNLIEPGLNGIYSSKASSSITEFLAWV